MDKEFLISFENLKKYCEKEDFKGWDPYDGLNSKLFHSIPWLKNSALARLIVIQGFKRNPVNLRKLALVPKEYNAKGIGLFLSGYCNLYKAFNLNPKLSSYLGEENSIYEKINYLANLLISLKSKGDYHGACWGYNFDWQARRTFLFPKYTPTVVATNFCATALLEAYEITQDKTFLEIALSSADFVIKDLHRSKVPGGFLFSYSPLSGNDTVYNASILGARLLSYCYKYNSREEYIALARETLNACSEAQNKDGSWIYGMKSSQGWIDSFHTGYNLEGFYAYQKITGDHSFKTTIEKGFRYYIDNFFLPEGIPKYYNNRVYPIDIHCPGELFVVLDTLNVFKDHHTLADKVLDWTIRNMQDKKGYFYYQLKQGVSSKIPYMRWSNAFMFNAYSHFLFSTILNKGLSNKILS